MQPCFQPAEANPQTPDAAAAIGHDASPSSQNGMPIPNAVSTSTQPATTSNTSTPADIVHQSGGAIEPLESGSTDASTRMADNDTIVAEHSTVAGPNLPPEQSASAD